MNGDGSVRRVGTGDLEVLGGWNGDGGLGG